MADKKEGQGSSALARKKEGLAIGYSGREMTSTE